MEAALPLGDIETPLRQLIALLKGFGAGLCDEAKLQRAKQTALTNADALEAQIPTYESLAYLNWYKDDWLNGHTTVSVADYVASVRRIVPTVTLSEINENGCLPKPSRLCPPRPTRRANSFPTNRFPARLPDNGK